MKQLAAGGVIAVFGSRGRIHAAPEAKVESIRVISRQPHLYHGWPTLTRRKSGQLWLVWSGGRESHVCPFGQVVSMVSNDDGRTWTWPRVLMDSALDDRDAGILETAKGTLLVTTFTSLAYENSLTAAEKRPSKDSSTWPAEKLLRWQAARDRLSAEQRREQLGHFMLRSTDGGTTWSRWYSAIVTSPHGPIQLADGRLLFPGRAQRQGEPRIGVCESIDDGQTWHWLATIPERSGDRYADYHELHAVETADERIVAHIRNHNKANSRETLQTESSDGGKTWSVPHAIGVWGLPSHLLRLKDDRLLMSYGYRRAPFGNQARISDDHGRTWSKPLVISDDGAGGDLGYPSTVQLDDGSLLSVWYEKMKDSPMAVLRQARWQLT